MIWWWWILPAAAALIGLVLLVRGLRALFGGRAVRGVAGAALGGLCIALFEVLWSAAMPLEQRDIAVYALLAVVLILRPGGFFGDGALAPRPV